MQLEPNSQPAATEHSTQFLCPCLLSLFALRVERQVPDKGGRRDTFLSAASLCALPVAFHRPTVTLLCCGTSPPTNWVFLAKKIVVFPMELCVYNKISVLKPRRSDRRDFIVALFTVCSNLWVESEGLRGIDSDLKLCAHISGVYAEPRILVGFTTKCRQHVL